MNRKEIEYVLECNVLRLQFFAIRVYGLDWRKSTCQQKIQRISLPSQVAEKTGGCIHCCQCRFMAPVLRGRKQASDCHRACHCDSCFGCYVCALYKAQPESGRIKLQVKSTFLSLLSKKEH